MKKLVQICLAMTFLTATPVWAKNENIPLLAVETEPMKKPSSTSSEGARPDMTGASRHHRGGPGMMPYETQWGPGGEEDDSGMGPCRQGWQQLSPQQQVKWRMLRATFMRDSLLLRQQLNSKQLEIYTLWVQQKPDMEKVKALANQITDLRTKLQQDHNDYLIRCRQEFGDLGWTCPGGSWPNY